MSPRIEILTEKKIIGQRLSMTMANNKTAELWRGFMPRRKEIINPVNNELISMQVYDSFLDVNNFIPQIRFDKWAAVEVSNFDSIPAGMEQITVPAGLYAVFFHKGAANTGPNTFQYIFGTWLPNSGFDLDNRPHFEVLGEKYKNNHPDSEEDIWIPIKPKYENV